MRARHLTGVSPLEKGADRPAHAGSSWLVSPQRSFWSAAFGVRATLDQSPGTSRSIGRISVLIKNSTTDYTHWTVRAGPGTQQWAGISARGGLAATLSVTVSGAPVRFRMLIEYAERNRSLHEADVGRIQPGRWNSTYVLLYLREGPVPRRLRRPHRMALADGRAGDHFGGVGGVQYGVRRPEGGASRKTCRGWELPIGGRTRDNAGLADADNDLLSGSPRRSRQARVHHLFNSRTFVLAGESRACRIRHTGITTRGPPGGGSNQPHRHPHRRMLASEVWEMRRALIVIGVSFLFVLPSWSAVAAPRLEWTRQFPGWVMAVDTSSNGMTAVVGSRWAPGGHQTMSIVVYGPQGGQRWLRTWRPAGESAGASTVAVAPDGTIYVGGGRDRVVGYETESWWFLRRYSANGTLMWHRDQQPAQHPRTWGAIHAIALRGAGVVVAGGDTGCCDASAGQDGWIRAFGGNGGLLWTNRFEPPGIPSRTQDLVWDVAVHHGAIYAAGYVAIGTAEEPWKDHEAVVARLTPGGSLAWARVFRDRGSRTTSTPRGRSRSPQVAPSSRSSRTGSRAPGRGSSASVPRRARCAGRRGRTDGRPSWRAPPAAPCTSSPVTPRPTGSASSDHGEGWCGPPGTSGDGSPISASPPDGYRWSETTRPKVGLAFGGTSSADTSRRSIVMQAGPGSGANNSPYCASGLGMASGVVIADGSGIALGAAIGATVWRRDRVCVSADPASLDGSKVDDVLRLRRLESRPRRDFWPVTRCRRADNVRVRGGEG